MQRDATDDFAASEGQRRLEFRDLLPFGARRFGGTLLRRPSLCSMLLGAVLVLSTGVAHAGRGGGAAAATVSSDAPPSPTLQRATKLYDKGDYYSASIELKKVLDGETPDSPENKQRA